MRNRGRHARPSRLRKIVSTAGLSTAVAIPLTGLTMTPAAAHPVPTRPSVASVAPAGVSYPTLRQGSQGTAVAELERRLGITADGVFGPVTRQAVISFQAARGLAVDGIVGPRTWGALAGRSGVAAASRSGQRSVSSSSSVGAAAVNEASRHVGKPYIYGAEGPNAFDCSGFVQYVYGRVGVNLPRTAAQQAAAARPVPRGSEQLGDLIIFSTGGTVTHLGIYAGGGTMWVARRSGTTITRQTIYTGDYRVGRVA